METVRAICFRFWPAMLAVIVLMCALHFVGWAEGKRAVKRWIEGGF